jgi:hypothetical protein
VATVGPAGRGRRLLARGLLPGRLLALLRLALL